MSDTQPDRDPEESGDDGFDFDFDLEGLENADESSAIAPDDTMNVSFTADDEDDESSKD